MLKYATTQCRVQVAARTRTFATRPHPLATRVTPKGPVPAGKTPPHLRPKAQRFSPLTLVLLATLTGSTTYALGKREGQSEREVGQPLKWREPNREGFDKALADLRAYFPPECVDDDRDALIAHGWNDWAAHGPTGLPGAIVYPRTTEDVVKIVKTAAANSIPLIPYCAGTSLEGHTAALGYPGAVEALPEGHSQIPLEELTPGLALVIDFAENMNQIITINSKDLDAVVQPGVSYDVLNTELKERGIPLFFPVDPAPGAQIGGMIGTGASGTNAVRYGTMRDNVLNLTVVLANGEVIKTRQRAKKSSVGPDLSRLIIGSEGIFGIVTEATLKLAPLLPSTVAASSFPTIQAAADAARDLVQQGVSIACVELLDDVMMKAINANDAKGRQWPEKPTLFLKFSGSKEQIKNDVARTKTITQSNKGSNFTFAKDDADAEQIWQSRKIALWSALNYRPGARCWTTDVCVPLSKFPDLITETKEDIDASGIVGPIVSHAGDGNFHALLLFSNDDELRKVEGLVHRMVERAQAMDGTCTGEHGVGIGKKAYIENELGAGTVNLLRSLKQTLDPQGIMNPGKLIPGESK
ncbi:uncharacterized protein JCM15063_001912 [Sporobolomyces koalae]|uniref:uncharacterized protein n=1 Tax=Sporobolomyces koalae TaxID=500713 RepID=UPI00316C130F